ncbi:MAG TPA: virulence-associated E family protein, partial [Xanthobacteraceae bacterium]
MYTAAVGTCMLIAAVARIYEPGCKADAVPIFEGKQGLLKSTAIKTMFYPWFTDELADLGSKDAAMQTRGIWGIEISELDAMTRGEVSKIKAFVSRTTDRFRPPYGKRVIESKRSCVFVGSTNSDDYLKDASGARRFQPVDLGVTGDIDIEGLRRDRDLLWAEAVI